MSVQVRHYKGKEDFDLISDFLIKIYSTDENNRYHSWLQPRWEYMHYHPNLNVNNLDKLGIFEDDGTIVGVVNYEDDLGTAYFSLNPSHRELKYEMLKYAEEHIRSIKEDGKKRLVIYINDFDEEFKQIAKEHGYIKNDKYKQYDTISAFDLTKEIDEITLPDGFKVKGLNEDNDLYKINRCLWRGFNHEGEAPASKKDIDERKMMQSGPNFKKELNIVVEAPDGEFVSYAGFWYVSENNIAYVEPVATDPKYRRMGLGKAAMLEGLKRCKDLGATVAYVESAIPFYLSIGFEPIFARLPWEKDF